MINNIDQDTLNLIIKMEEYEKTFNLYKLDIEKQKKNEINRINKEFLTNDYQRRFNANLHMLISAIYGEDNMSIEFSRLIKEQKVTQLVLWNMFFCFVLFNYKLIKFNLVKFILFYLFILIFKGLF